MTNDDELTLLRHQVDLLEQRWKFAIEGVGYGVWDWNVVTDEEHFSDRILQMLGATEGQLAPSGSAWDARIHPDDRVEVHLRLHEHVAGRSPWYEHEHRVRHEDGHWVWIRDRGLVTERDELGRPQRLIGTCHDITAERQAAADRDAFDHERREAARLEAVVRLAGGLAHEFNNRLGVIIGRAELVSERAAHEPDVVADAQAILHAGLRCAELTRELLAFARRQTVSPQVVQLDDVVRAVAPELEELVGSVAVLELRLQPELWAVHIDPAQAAQIVTNLCRAARDGIASAATGRTGHIVIAASNDTVGGRVRLTVVDDGPEVPPAALAHVFEPFFDAGRISRQGLALATVHGAVAQNGGVTQVTSGPGRTVFEVLLPRHLTEGAPAGGPVATRVASPGGSTILVVEDETSILELITTVLEMDGHEVIATESPARALDLLDSSRPIALVLTDVMMPGMNGRDLVAALAERGVVAPTLFMSGYPADIIATGGVVDAAVHFIQKPFTLGELQAKVAEALASTKRS